MTAALMLWAVAAWAGADASSSDEEADVEVIVYGEFLIEQARAQVERNLLEQGYSRVRGKGDRTIYQHEQPHRGQVVVYEDGWMEVRRQPVRLEGREMPWAERNTALAWAGCVLWPFLCVRPGGQTVGKRKFKGVEDRTVRRVHGDVTTWSDRIADRATEEKVQELPDRLEALWARGEPLDGEGNYLEDPPARRAALLAFWGSRTDSTWGRSVRGAVEAFVRAVVQNSDHPFTEEEIARFNEHRSGEPFTLARKGSP